MGNERRDGKKKERERYEGVETLYSKSIWRRKTRGGWMWWWMGGAERGVGYCNKDQEETTKETGRAKKVRQK